MRISDWSSDVCSSDLQRQHLAVPAFELGKVRACREFGLQRPDVAACLGDFPAHVLELVSLGRDLQRDQIEAERADHARQEPAHALQPMRSGEHTSEIQSLKRLSYAVFRLNKKTKHNKYS